MGRYLWYQNCSEGQNQRCLLTISAPKNVEEYIKKNLVTDKFTVVIHGEDDGANLCLIQLVKKFYKLLKNRFFEELNFCIILKAKFTLKAVFKLAKPFILYVSVVIIRRH
ncbi:uncharacterized protein [Pocillopora verrucosa]|uniref:uncharacterized protein isoform X4 n=1 Tax=Pocillopora verrucosa TaxID=203993 RepID=UPI00333EEDAA